MFTGSRMISPARALALAALGSAALLRSAHPAPVANHDHTPMSADRAVQIELGADAAFDPQGVLWAVHKLSGHIALSHSGDAGRTWSGPVLVTPNPEATDPGSDSRPKIALGPGGEIYVTWTRPLDQPFTGEIRFTRSLDGGRTFQRSRVVHRDRQIITHRFDALAVNSAGQVFVAWIDKRDLASATAAGVPYRGAAIYFAVSDDRGGLFRGDFKVADHTCECCRIALAPRPDGTIAAMWRHVIRPNIRDHAVAQLHPDGTASGLRRATFDDWRIDACPHHGPALAVDSTGLVHAVWFSASPQSRGVFYGRLRSGGIDAQHAIGAPPAGNADIAVDGNRVAIAWKDFADGRARLRAMISDDGGRDWQRLELSSTGGPSGHPRVLLDRGRFHVFWSTPENPLAIIPLDEVGP